MRKISFPLNHSASNERGHLRWPLSQYCPQKLTMMIRILACQSGCFLLLQIGVCNLTTHW